MKKILLFLLLPLVGGCGVSKNKQKEKQLTEIEENLKVTNQGSVKENSDSRKNVSDSTASQSKYNIDRSLASALQNFSLKNNGKCGDPGITRFVQFSDALGNKTAIPVNDNTDLDFHNETDLKKEIEILKTEKLTVKKENEKLVKSNESLSNQVNELSTKLKAKSTKSDTKTEKNSFSSFALIAVLAIVVWEILKKLIKKYLFK